MLSWKQHDITASPQAIMKAVIFLEQHTMKCEMQLTKSVCLCLTFDSSPLWAAWLTCWNAPTSAKQGCFVSLLRIRGEWWGNSLTCMGLQICLYQCDATMQSGCVLVGRSPATAADWVSSTCWPYICSNLSISHKEYVRVSNIDLYLPEQAKYWEEWTRIG